VLRVLRRLLLILYPAEGEKSGCQNVNIAVGELDGGLNDCVCTSLLRKRGLHHLPWLLLCGNGRCVYILRCFGFAIAGRVVLYSIAWAFSTQIVPTNS